MFGDKSNIQKTTRGGQITLHNIRMYAQVLKALGLTVLVVMFVFNFLWYFTKNDNYERHVFASWVGGNIRVSFNEQATQSFQDRNGKIITVYSKKFMNVPKIRETVDDVVVNIFEGVLLSLVLGVSGFFGVNYWFKRRGEAVTKERLINDHKVVPPQDINKLQRKRNQVSDIPIGEIHMVKGSENGHIFTHGTTGSGKSTFIKRLIAAAREMGDKVIVLDKSCDLTQHFYDTGNSIILNPFDKRSPAWNVWSDARDSADLHVIAESIMPMPNGGQDPFWVNAARQIFAATAFEMRNDKEKTNVKLLRNLLTADLAKMEAFLKNTEAATLVSESIEKTAVSIKAVMSTNLRSLKYLKDDGDSFSIRKWIADEWDKPALFITSLADKHPMLRPLISMWLDIAINATMSLAPDMQRRIWIVLDELHSMHMLPSLFDGSNEVRKFGGCFVVGTTSYAGLCDLYGTNRANSIIEQFNTSLYFRTPRAERAIWVSKELGESEIEEMHESISFGANTMRDGVNISKQIVRKPAVPYTDIMKLDPLQAYVKLPGSYPITKVNFEIMRKKEFAQPGFVQREINEDIFKELTELEDQYIETVNNPSALEKMADKEKKKKSGGSVKTKTRGRKPKIEEPPMPVEIPPQYEESSIGGL